MKNYTVTTSEISDMKHTIGFNDSKVTGIKNRKMSAYRNYYTTSSTSPKFHNLINQGLMEEHDFPNGVGTDPKCYTVTDEGLKFLSEITGIEIIEMD